MEQLVCWQMEPIIHHAHVYRTDRVRTFGHNDRVCGQRSGGEVAQPAPREHVVVYIKPIIGGQKDGKTGPQGAVLHGIVQDDHVEMRKLAAELLYSPHSVLTHRNRHFGKSAMELHRFVADRFDRSVLIRHDEAARRTLIPAREDRRVVAAVQEETDYIRRHRRLACPPHRQVTHADRGHRDGEGGQEMPVIEPMANRHTCSVEPRERDVKSIQHSAFRIQLYLIVTSGMSAMTRGLEQNSRTFITRRSSSVVLSSIFSSSSYGSVFSG